MADITTSQIFTDGERGITATKMNAIIGGSAIQPAFYTSKPTAGTADPADIALILKAGAYSQIPISALAGSATQAQIWSTRLRSYSSIGNPNFEIDQRLCGTTAGFASAAALDRWIPSKTGAAAMSGTYGQISVTPSVMVPGTSFAITAKIMRITLLAQLTTLAAGDSVGLLQYVEGPQWRELMSDVHSVSVLVRSNVAGLSFGLFLKDPPTATKSLTLLCTIPSANTWTLVTFPNLPVWPSGNFVTTPGSIGYQIGICLAAGSTFTSPSNLVWNAGNFIGAVGQGNFGAQAVNSTLDIAFIQHEPGAVCSTLMDKPFSQNLDEAQRYYTKSYSYQTIAGTVTSAGSIQTLGMAGFSLFSGMPFKRIMAKIPTVIGYSPVTGAINTLRDVTGGADKSITASNYVSDAGFTGFNVTGPNASNWIAQVHYTADSGW